MTELITTDSIKPARAPFHVLVKPIGPLCNLDCEYCFYLKKTDMFKGSKFRMSDDLLELHIRRYIETQPQGTNEIAFAWQGGEPTLLGIDFFRKVIELQDRYRKTGTTISNGFQTNGTRLDRNWCEFLRENNFLVGISIDGPEHFHNKFRKTKGGKGSFRAVMKGLENLQQFEVDYNILTVIQRHNGDFPLEVYRGLRELGAEHIQFIPIIEQQEDEQVSTRSVLPNQYGEFMNAVFDEWLSHDIGRIYIQQVESALNSLINQSATICVHAETCGRALALEHNGDLFACDHFVFDEFRLGNISRADYPELVDGSQQTEFGLAKKTKLTERCLRCDVRHYCNGGCPAHQFITIKNETFRHNYLCEGYRAYFRHMRPYLEAIAEALRLNLPASNYHRFLSGKKTIVGRNDPCPCGSGRKFKRCCAR